MDIDNLFPVTGLSGQTLSAVTSSNVSFSAFPAAAYVEISISAQPVIVTFDGSVPTAQNGLFIPKELGTFVWPAAKASAAKFRSSSSTALIYGVGLTWSSSPSGNR